MYPRKLESSYSHTKYIHEFWNTISNLVFVIIGIIRLYDAEIYEQEDLFNLYVLYTMAGFCSGIHHATHYKMTIIIDWIPISGSIIYICYNYYLLHYISLVSWIKIITALFVLMTDHVCTPVNVPWGHVFWHVFAGFAIDSAYTDILRFIY